MTQSYGALKVQQSFVVENIGRKPYRPRIVGERYFLRKGGLAASGLAYEDAYPRRREFLLNRSTFTGSREISKGSDAGLNVSQRVARSAKERLPIRSEVRMSMETESITQ